MRKIINISLPEELNKLVEKEIKKGKFASKSEFIRNLLRLWEEKKLIGKLEDSRKEIKGGKGKALRSLADLD